jgi:hypothetical protein
MSGRPYLRLVPGAAACKMERETFTFIRVTDSRDGFDEVFVAHNGDVGLPSNPETWRALEHWIALIRAKIDGADLPLGFPGGMK